MNKGTHYTNEPLEIEEVEDFLPSPEDLVYREDGVKVTLALSKRSVAFFKHEAARHHAPYQRMIRRLLDAYVDHFASNVPTRANRRAARPGTNASATLPTATKRPARHNSGGARS